MTAGCSVCLNTVGLNTRTSMYASRFKTLKYFKARKIQALSVYGGLNILMFGFPFFSLAVFLQQLQLFFS